MKKVFVYGIAALALSAAPVLAQQPGGAGAAGPRPGSTTSTQGGTGAGGSATRGGASGSQAAAPKGANADHDFVMEAAMGSMAEVELGQLASEKAQSEPVKQFAQRMVTDHGRANAELKTLAQNKNISLPTDSGAHHKAIKDRLSKLSGAAFDRAYMQEMLTDHRKDVNAFTRESQSGKDADVKAWAAKTLPTLKEHLSMAQTASRGAVGTSGTRSSDGQKSTGGAKSGGSDRGTSGPAGGDAAGGSPTTPRSGGPTGTPR